MEIAKERVGKMKPTIISGWIAAGDGGGAVCLVWERSKAFCEPELITEENDLGGRD